MSRTRKACEIRMTTAIEQGIRSAERYLAAYTEWNEGAALNTADPLLAALADSVQGFRFLLSGPTTLDGTAPRAHLDARCELLLVTLGRH